MRILVPPIKCQGIKTKLVQWIVAHVSLGDTERWIERFMGSGVVGFNLRPRKAIFGDINPHIINFYNVGASEENRNPMLEAIVLNYTPQKRDAANLSCLRSNPGAAPKSYTAKASGSS